jgi:hypothetical protein
MLRQRLVKRGLFDDLRPRDVDEERGPFHQAELQMPDAADPS